jgi:comEA protein
LRGSNNNKRNKKRTPSSGASTLAKAIDPPPLLPSTNAPEGERGNQSDAENVTDDLRSNFAQAESQTKDVTSTPPDPSPRDERSESTTVVTVHVIGAVRAPGVYELPLGSRVNDAVERAGGPSIVADLSGTNLARKLVDGEQVNIPKRVVGVRENQPIATPEILDLNLASAEQLAGLPGIGMDLAKAIVAHRRRIGQFANVNQLLDVKGIGERKFAAIKGRLRT